MKRNARVTMMVLVFSAAVLSACNAVTPVPGALGYYSTSTLYAPAPAAGLSNPVPTSANLADQEFMAELTRMASGGQLDTYNTQVAVVNAQGTQIAAEGTQAAMLATQVAKYQTQTPAAATMQAAQTRDTLAMQATQDELARLNANAQATLSAAQTRDVLTLEAQSANATGTAQAQATATAILAAQMTQMAQVQATATAMVAAQMTEIAHAQATATVVAALAAQAQAERNAAWTWLWTQFMPYFVAGVGVVIVILGWRWMKLHGLRQAMVMRENGAGPLMLVQQRRPLSDYPADLPTLLRYVAWLMDSGTLSVVNPDRADGPVVRLNSDGTADVPLVSGNPGAQERTVARQQSIELMTRQAEVARRNAPVLVPPAFAAPQSQALPLVNGEVIEGEVREVEDSGDVKHWLDDVEVKLLED